MNLDLPASMSLPGVEATIDRARGETVLTEPCTWCGAPIETRIADRDLVAYRGELRALVVDRLIVGRVVHLSVEQCATAGHDPGDEDVDETLRRLAWHPAGGGG